MHTQRLALAQQDRRRVGAVGHLHEHPEELAEKDRQVPLFERRRGDPLEGSEPLHRLVALARAKSDVEAMRVLALLEEDPRTP